MSESSHLQQAPWPAAAVAAAPMNGYVALPLSPPPPSPASSGWHSSQPQAPPAATPHLQPSPAFDSHYEQFMQSLGAGVQAPAQQRRPLPLPPPPPAYAAAMLAATPAPAPAASSSSSWTAVDLPASSRSAPRLTPRPLLDFSFQRSERLAPLHPSLAVRRPTKLIAFVQRGSMQDDAAVEESKSGTAETIARNGTSAPAATGSAATAAAASHIAAAAPSPASAAASSPATSACVRPPQTRLELKLQGLLCSLLEAGPMRLLDLSSALQARDPDGGGWEDRTTESIESFIRQRQQDQARGPFRLQSDGAQHKGNPLVYCVAQDANTSLVSSDVASAAASASSASISAAPAAAIAASPAPAAAASVPTIRAYCVLVSNIPASFHSADLRHFFSNFVEANRFAVFQPTHRRDEEGDVQKMTADSRKRRFEAIEASVAPAASAGSSRREYSWKCMVQLRKRADVERMKAEYNDTEWISRKGERMGQLCRVRFVPLPRRLLRHTEAVTAAASEDLTADDVIDLTDDTTAPPVAAAAAAAVAAPTITEEEDTPAEAAAAREIMAAYKAGEFAAPAYLPQGLVGTSTKVVRANFAHLPTSLIQRLHLTPAVTSLNANKFAPPYAASSSAVSLPAADVDDDPARLDLYARQRVRDEASDQEEWDRDADQGPRRAGAFDSGRGLGKIGDGETYEDEVEQVWDKGDASGLVHYTDAQRERAEKGGFDEQTVDMWGVDEDDDDESVTHDSDVEEESPEARAQRKAVAAEKMRLRMAEASAESSRIASASAAAAAKAKKDQSLAWSRSAFLTKMMSKMGHVEGSGLGKAGQGIAEPIQPVDRGATRGGLGFVDRRQSWNAGGSAAAAAQDVSKRAAKRQRRHANQVAKRYM